MPRTSEGWLKISGILLFLVVGIGAFGAHALRPILGDDGKRIFDTAVMYQAIHSIAIGLVALTQTLQLLKSEKHGSRVCTLFLAGIILFSGSLYLLATTHLSWLGAITPFGGILFLAGWASFVHGVRKPL